MGGYNTPSDTVVKSKWSVKTQAPKVGHEIKKLQLLQCTYILKSETLG